MIPHSWVFLSEQGERVEAKVNLWVHTLYEEIGRCHAFSMPAIAEKAIRDLLRSHAIRLATLEEAAFAKMQASAGQVDSRALQLEAAAAVALKVEERLGDAFSSVVVLRQALEQEAGNEPKG